MNKSFVQRFLCRLNLRSKVIVVVQKKMSQRRFCFVEEKNSKKNKSKINNKTIISAYIVAIIQ